MLVLDSYRIETTPKSCRQLRYIPEASLDEAWLWHGWNIGPTDWPCGHYMLFIISCRSILAWCCVGMRCVHRQWMVHCHPANYCDGFWWPQKIELWWILRSEFGWFASPFRFGSRESNKFLEKSSTVVSTVPVEKEKRELILKKRTHKQWHVDCFSFLFFLVQTSVLGEFKWHENKKESISVINEGNICPEVFPIIKGEEKNEPFSQKYNAIQHTTIMCD